MCYPKSVSFIEFLIDLSIYDDMLDTIHITNVTGPTKIDHVSANYAELYFC